MPAVAVLIDLGVFLALVLMIGLYKGYSFTFGALLQGLSKLLNAVALTTPFGTFRPLHFAAEAVVELDNAIRRSFGAGINTLQATWNEAVSYTAQAIHWVGHEIAALAHDTAQAVETLSVRQVTNVYRKVNPGLARKVGVLAAAVAALTHRLEHVVGREAHVAKAKAQAVERAVALPAPIAIPKTLPKVGRLERDVDALGRRIKALYKSLTVAGIIGLVGATIFDQFGLGWLRCKGVNRVGRKLCGLSSVIESLAADAIDVLLVTHLCRIVSALAAGAREAAPAFDYLVSLTEGLIKCQKAERPGEIAVAWYAPPPSEGLVSFDPLG